jgi:hypothetical protein
MYMFLRVGKIEVRFCKVPPVVAPNLGVHAAENQKLEIRNWKLAPQFLVSNFQFPVSNFHLPPNTLSFQQHSCFKKLSTFVFIDIPASP